MSKLKVIGVIGIGKLGLALSLNFERAGFKVYGCDIKESYIEDINKKKHKTIEPSVKKLLKKSKNFLALSDLKKTLLKSDVIFLTVRTMTNKDGSYDVSQCDTVINSIIKIGAQKKKKTFIINCNVNPGFTNKVKKQLLPLNYKVSFNPEWVAQGSIINDQSRPDVIVIGEPSAKEGSLIEKIYNKMCLNSPKVFKMDALSAEITKISLNCFLTTKITFANMIGDIANKVGANHKKILQAIGEDKRIGNKYFSYGFGYGGPCFPRDNRAIIKYMKSIDIRPLIPKATQKFNELHLDYQINSFTKDNSNFKKNLKISGVTYKQGVDIIEESQQLKYAVKLQSKGYKITIEDLASVCKQIRKIYGNKFKYIEL